MDHRARFPAVTALPFHTGRERFRLLLRRRPTLCRPGGVACPSPGTVVSYGAPDCCKALVAVTRLALAQLGRLTEVDAAFDSVADRNVVSGTCGTICRDTPEKEESREDCPTRSHQVRSGHGTTAHGTWHRRAPGGKGPGCSAPALRSAGTKDLLPAENAGLVRSVHEFMGRTPNDDRSDTMNPNNDAYRADQENRFGSGYDSSDDADSDSAQRPPSGEPERHPMDDLADPNLGPPSRYRIDFDSLRWSFEEVLATPESEERDRKAAIAEALRMSERILNVAAEAANRQCVNGHVLTGPGWCELVLGDGRSLRVEEVSEHGHLAIIGGSTARFGFARRAWRAVTERRSGYYNKPTRYEQEFGSPHPLHQVTLLSHIVEAVKKGAMQDGLAKYRDAIRQVKDQLEHDRYNSSSHLCPARNAQERIGVIKSKLPPGVVNDSWEDTWSPDEKTSESGRSA